MGAYENPAMIQDKSGEILAQGFQSFTAGIAKGVATKAERENKELEARRKRIAQQQQDAANAEIKAGDAALKFDQQINDWKKENPSDTSEDGIKIYDEKAKVIGGQYYDAARVYYNPNSAVEDRKKAWDQMSKLTKDIGFLQNEISNVGVNTQVAAGFAEDTDTVYLPINRGEGETSLTAEQSKQVVEASSSGYSNGYLDENTEYTAEYDDNNNLKFTFKNINTGKVLFEETVNSSTKNAMDQYAVKSYNGKDRINEYSIEQGIKNDDGLFTEAYKGKTEVKIEGNTKTTSTTYPASAINNKYGELYKEIKTKLTTSSSKNKAATGARVNAFFKANGYTDEQIGDIRLGKGEFEGKTVDQVLDSAIQQYVINSITPGYKLNEDGDFVVSSTKEYKAPRDTDTPTWEIKLQDFQNNFGVADTISSGNFYLKKSPAVAGQNPYYQLYKWTGSSGGEATSSLVDPSKKYYITDNNKNAVYDAASAMGLTGSSTLPRFNQ